MNHHQKIQEKALEITSAIPLNKLKTLPQKKRIYEISITLRLPKIYDSLIPKFSGIPPYLG